MSLARWPRELVRRTARLTKAAAWPGAWKDAAAARGLVAEAFGAFAGRGVPAAVRVFIEGALRFDLGLRVITGAPAPGTEAGFARWLDRLAGHRRFCVTLNGLTRWSEALHRCVHEDIAHPLFQAAGPPPGGAELYVFAGNHRSTPFGAHADDEHTVLLHLGPGPKVAYVWPRRVYLQERGSALPSFDYARLRRSAQRYRLQTGDLLFIPRGDFHVLECRGFSLMLGLSLFPARGPVDRLQRALLESNGHVADPPLQAEMGRRRSPVATRFQAPRHFPILTLPDGSGGAIVFVRGRAMRVSRRDGLARLTAALNEGGSLQYGEYRALVGPSWDDRSARELFNRLVRNRGLVAVDAGAGARTGTPGARQRAMPGHAPRLLR